MLRSWPLIALLLVGCTHTRSFDTRAADPTTDAMRAEVNERAEQSDARGTLLTGERVVARSLHIAPDVTTWLDPATGATRSAPTTDVLEVRFTRRGNRALQGAGIGLTAGVGTGAVLGYALGDDCPEAGLSGVGCFDRASSAVIFGIFLGVVGTAAGGVVGLVQGSRIEYARSPQSPGQ